MTQPRMRHLTGESASILRRIKEKDVNVCRWIGAPKPTKDVRAVLDGVCDVFWFSNAGKNDPIPFAGPENELHLDLKPGQDLQKVFSGYARQLVRHARSELEQKNVSSLSRRKQEELNSIKLRLTKLNEKQIEATGRYLATLFQPAFAILAAKALELEQETDIKHTINFDWLSYTDDEPHRDGGYFNMTCSYRRPGTIFYPGGKHSSWQAKPGEVCLFKSTVFGSTRSALHGGISLPEQRRHRGMTFSMFLLKRTP